MLGTVAVLAVLAVLAVITVAHGVDVELSGGTSKFLNFVCFFVLFLPFPLTWVHTLRMPFESRGNLIWIVNNGKILRQCAKCAISPSR